MSSWGEAPSWPVAGLAASVPGMEDMIPVMKASAVLRRVSSLQDSAPESETTSWVLDSCLLFPPGELLQ